LIALDRRTLDYVVNWERLEGFQGLQGDEDGLALALMSLALQQLALLVLAHLLASLLDHTSHEIPRRPMARLASADEY